MHVVKNAESVRQYLRESIETCQENLNFFITHRTHYNFSNEQITKHMNSQIDIMTGLLDDLSTPEQDQGTQTPMDHAP